MAARIIPRPSGLRRRRSSPQYLLTTHRAGPRPAAHRCHLTTRPVIRQVVG